MTKRCGGVARTGRRLDVAKHRRSAVFADLLLFGAGDGIRTRDSQLVPAGWRGSDRLRRYARVSCPTGLKFACAVTACSDE